MDRRIAILFALGLVAAACDTGSPADPASPVGATAARGALTPLRRLTRIEYLNALHDLFPSVNPTLPALPADVAVAGFENAAEAQQPSDVLVSRNEAIANLYAEAVAKDPSSLRAIVDCTDWSTPTKASACTDSFFAKTGTRIFRRPLTKEERHRLLERFQAWQGAVDFEAAVQLTLSAMLQSPQFLYRVETVPKGQAAGSAYVVDGYTLATRLSFFLWESVPDEELLDAAAHGELDTEEGARTAAQRMLEDDRAQRVFWDFPRQWLGLDRIALAEHQTRSAEVDPSWSSATQSSANEEMRLFVTNTLARGGTFRDLMTSRRAWVDGEMARVYGLPAPADSTAWTETKLPADERAGLLTRVSFLAGYSHAGATSPPVRGNALQLRFLCSLPTSPPANADLSQPTPAPGDGPKTTRTLFETRTQGASCQSCHQGLNGFGFGLENFDAAGHFRTSENGLAIDARGLIVGTDVDGPYNGAHDLSEAIARSGTVHECATRQMVRYALGRAPAADEASTVSALAKGFMESDGDLRALLLSIATSPTFRSRTVEDDSP